MRSLGGKPWLVLAIALTTAVGCAKRPSSNGLEASTAAQPATAQSGATSLDSLENGALETQPRPGLDGSGSAALSAVVVGSANSGTATSPAARAQVTRDAFTDFGEDTTVSEVESEPQGDLMYVVESDGTLRVLDTAGDQPQLVRAFSLFEQPVGPGQGFGRFELVRPDLALLPTQGEGFQGVAMFDPSAAQSSADVRWFDLGGLSATWPAGATNSQGVEVGSRALRITDVTGATLVGDLMFLSAANTNTEGDHNPGVVLAMQLQGERLVARAMIRTSRFNPTGLSQLGQLLLVTNSGSYGQSGASVDVIDTQSARRLSTIEFPERMADGRAPDPFGPVAVDPTGTQGFVGSMSQARVYALDLQAMAFAEEVTLASQSTRNATRQLSFSGDGAKLYVANPGDSSLSSVDVATQRTERVAGFERKDRDTRLDTFAVKPTRDGDAVLAVVGGEEPTRDGERKTRDGERKQRTSLDKVTVQ